MPKAPHQSLASIKEGLSKPGLKLCLDCANHEQESIYSEFGVLVRHNCRALAKLGPNLVDGYPEWQGRTLPCADARRRGAGSCGPSGRLFKKKPLSWWRKDQYGWPIEWITNRPVLSALRLVLQNIRKVTG